VRRDPRGRPCLDHLFDSGNPWFTQTRTTRESETDDDDEDDVAEDDDTSDDDTSDDEEDGTRAAVGKTKELLHPVGRLDYDTTGLLLFSSSGPLTQTLLHPKHAVEKEYVATVTGTVNADKLRATLAAGVVTGEGVHTANLLNVSHFEKEQVAPYLQAIQADLPAEYNQTDLKSRGYLDVLDATELTTVTVTVKEGKHRMVRRILANAGHPVVSLHRARLGEIELGDLPVGGIRELTEPELRWARKLLHKENLQKRADFEHKMKQGRTVPKEEADDDDETVVDEHAEEKALIRKSQKELGIEEFF